MTTGWIKISRDLPNHWLWQDAERLKWWLDLLFMASWEESKVLHDTHLITLERGQMIASISFLASRWKKSEHTVIKFLKILESEEMIVRSVLHRQTPILTICNYAKYQADVQGQVQGIVHTQMQGQVQGIVQGNKEIKEIKDIKTNNNMAELTKLEEEFEVFRKAYKGNKRGFKVEFENFKKKYPKEWQQIIPLLMPALQRMEEWRAAASARGEFVPQYAMLQTWINQRRWETEYPTFVTPQPQSKPQEPPTRNYGGGFGGADY